MERGREYPWRSTWVRALKFILYLWDMKINSIILMNQNQKKVNRDFANMTGI